MSLKQKFISTAALAFAVGAFGTFVSAQETPSQDSAMQQEKYEKRGGRGRGMRGGKHGGDRMMMRSLGNLNLTDTQKEQLRTIFETSRTQNQPQMEEMRGLMMKKRDGVITADEQTRLRELRMQNKQSSEQTRDLILSILTPEQRTQYETMKQEMRQKMTERRQNRQNRQNQTTSPDSDS